MASSSSSSSSLSLPTSPLKVLMLHGKTQSGQLFYAKTRALEKHLVKACAPTRLAFYYPDAPHRLYLRDIPDVDTSLLQSDEESEGMYTWWRKDEATGEYKGIGETWKFLSDYLDQNVKHLVPRSRDSVNIYFRDRALCLCAVAIKIQGPFIGAIGFSQGAGLAAILASILEPARQKPPAIISDGFTTSHPPLKFAVAYCGFKAPNEEYQWMYEPKIQTPVLNVLGSLDTVVDEKLMKGLVEVCEGNRVLWHPGGHYVVVKKQWLDAVGVFVRDNINGAGTSATATKSAKEEESVEDMEMPF
ncbi:hypothetical protein AA313_de0203403 [Arthrobotrys entomopaga]|nr:hypothetical protein AA313_de0203403 [Arthrobotrys entomopaga]